MRLKRLELQGYKTFATKTEFVFNDGITAIVGPNGSGKSNIADAVRWVLGEQSYRLLRAKRTEDMIFHGSSQRARVGMAQVSITLDNSDGWLPLDFAEVTITHRAYRSGENEYTINGSRVRLRDVTELLAKSGLTKRNSIVIGQGHIDAALSLRPEERRTLFEEAANITLYQSKRDASLAKLEATEQNLVRVRDILAEIEPRLKTLRRQAQQAEVYHALNRELEDLLRVWYGYRWRKGSRALQQAREALNQARQQLQQAQARLERLESQAASARAEQNTLRQQLAEWHRESADLHTRAEAVQRDWAVRQERLRLVGRLLAEAQEEMEPLEASRAAQAERLQAAESHLQGLVAQWEQAIAALRQVEAEYQSQQRARQEILSRITALQNELFEIATQAADRRNRLAQLAERRKEQLAEKAQHESAIAAQRDELGQLRAQQQALQQSLSESEREAARLRDALDQARQRIQAAQAQAREAEQEMSRVREEAATVQARLDMLRRMQEEGTGLYAGTRAVLAAAREGRLRGALGVVADQIQTPPELEKAVETALGAHLQDIITETWADAEQAIQYLRRESAGRATFLPLETLRPPSPVNPPDVPGVLGVAWRLVQAPKRLAPVLDLLLGHTVVAKDMKAARELYRQMRGAFQIVTLDGELIRSTGAITGGTETRKSPGLLSRQRERAEHEALLRDLAQRREALQAALHSAAEAEQTARDELAQAEREMSALAAKEAQLRASLAALQRQADKKAQETEWRQALIHQLDHNLEALAQKGTQARDDLAQLAQREADAQARLAQLQASLDAMPDSLAVPLAEAKAAVSLAEQNVENHKAIVRGHQQSLVQLDGQIESRRARMQALQSEREELEAAERDLRSRSEALAAQLEEVAARIRPAEARLQEMEAAQMDVEARIQKERAALREAEQAHNQALLEMERRRDELAALKRQMESDLGLIDVEIAEGLPAQPPLPLRPIVSSLPEVETLPDGLEEQIQQLRGQIRRLGGINPTAPTEYAETLERYNFLTSQSEDLQEADKSLRAAIAELDRMMNDEFVRTFEAVAEQFTVYFTQLFGGGTARLVLTDPDNPMASGVDIVARPPGKRTQSLALLSGGERALTAAALIFAILKVSPTPFCILDEVDAMLDESNVRRFRAVLEELARDTQFIVITHNRGTIEAASTIYGVSMGADSVSRVLSLRLDQVEAKV
ncbi:MAG: chromosome segregation protein SMC [Anaerolineales bacterium]